jgi:hypothetical protein
VQNRPRGRTGASRGCWLGKNTEGGTVPRGVASGEGCTEEGDAPVAEQANRAVLGLAPRLGVE